MAPSTFPLSLNQHVVPPRPPPLPLPPRPPPQHHHPRPNHHPDLHPHHHPHHREPRHPAPTPIHHRPHRHLQRLLVRVRHAALHLPAVRRRTHARRPHMDRHAAVLPRGQRADRLRRRARPGPHAHGAGHGLGLGHAAGLRGAAVQRLRVQQQRHRRALLRRRRHAADALHQRGRPRQHVRPVQLRLRAVPERHDRGALLPGGRGHIGGQPARQRLVRPVPVHGGGHTAGRAGGRGGVQRQGELPAAEWHAAGRPAGQHRALDARRGAGGGLVHGGQLHRVHTVG